MTGIKLGILDQSPVRSGSGRRLAIQETLQLAKLADDLGYERFWVSQHHDNDAYAGTAPETLMPTLLSETRRIKVGAAAILPASYSAYKIYELFELLTYLYVDRVELGLGRDTGTSKDYLKKLSSDFSPAQVPRKLLELEQIIAGEVPDLVPRESFPYCQRWYMCTGKIMAKLAAAAGAGVAVAYMGDRDAVKEAVATYRSNFQSSSGSRPRVILAINLVSGENPEELTDNLRISLWNDFLFYERKERFANLQIQPISVSDEILEMSSEVQSKRHWKIVSLHKDMKKTLAELQHHAEVDEFVVRIIGGDAEHRARSYRDLIEKFQ